MSKESVVSSVLAALSVAQSAAIGDGYESAFAEGVASVPPSSGGLSQADVAAAVKAQQDSDAQALSDAVSAVQAKLDSAVQALADMTAKDQKDSAAVLALKASAASIQAVLDQLNAIVNPPAPDSPAAA